MFCVTPVTTCYMSRIGAKYLIIFAYCALRGLSLFEFVWVCLESTCHKPVTFVKCDTNFSSHTCHNMLDESNRCKIFYHLCLLCTQKLEFVWVCLDSICHKPVILVNFDTKTCLSLPEFAWVCLGLLEFARVCSGLLEFAWVCLGLLGFAWVCLSLRFH